MSLLKSLRLGGDGKKDDMPQAMQRRTSSDAKDDSDEEINLDVILSAPIGQGSSRNVSFVDHKGIDDVIGSSSDTPDADKTHAELLTKIQTLMERLQQAEVDYSAQKSLRKQKEKSLMKLAKELKKRNEQRDEILERLDEVRAFSHLVYGFMTLFLTIRN